MQNNFALFLVKLNLYQLQDLTVAVANTNKSTPHHATTPRIVAAKIPTGKTCFADFGIPSLFLRA